MSSDFCLLIRNARILLPQGEFLQGDVQTRDREIVRVAPEIPTSVSEVDKVIDANGLTLLPGYLNTIMSPRSISRCGRNGSS